ncbi:HAD-IA family hydrolase [Aurantimonas sp. VKM B-3413]|uniref:HAD-IA family hydrolase n=1 Tax=Aurantimonas sp. VKM B-3413 TaxID=2779401 RepID=UPI001E4D4EB0|nr:HAD-IA family hydrolase [Aurantimonas sp. VKM B-3413]MCB8836870.1 HAD-IA family hydrolase [Aurantimonas sp. VKM B-3413]
MKAILFDCDGTIADSCGTICTVMRRAFLAEGLPEPDDAATRAIIGLSLETAMARLHPDGGLEHHVRLAGAYREAFQAMRREAEHRETLFPGMRDLVDRLATREDALLGMVTGKSRRGVTAICETHGLTRHFLAVRTADDCPSKPHPAMVEECCAELGVAVSDALVVGDSIYDIEMARAAGAHALGVAWGTHEAGPLVAAGAFAVAGDVSELEALIADWIGAEVPAAAAVGG